MRTGVQTPAFILRYEVSRTASIGHCQVFSVGHYPEFIVVFETNWIGVVSPVRKEQDMSSVLILAGASRRMNGRAKHDIPSQSFQRLLHFLIDVVLIFTASNDEAFMLGVSLMISCLHHLSISVAHCDLSYVSKCTMLHAEEASILPPLVSAVAS